jgi:hypothetical protein
MMMMMMMMMMMVVTAAAAAAAGLVIVTDFMKIESRHQNTIRSSSAVRWVNSLASAAKLFRDLLSLHFLRL